MKLYYSPASPFVRKVSVIARELGIPLQHEPVAVHSMTNDFGKINPVNRIPALALDDGSVMFDSRVICEYLDSTKGHRLLPAAGPARWQVLKLQVLGDGILDAAVPKRGEVLRPKEQQSPARIAEYDRSIQHTLAALERSTGDLAGLNLGTITIACALGYLDFRFANEPWRATHPKLTAWFAEFAKRPSMSETTPHD